MALSLLPFAAPRHTRVEGCICIPLTLGVFLDYYGILDAHYDRELAQGRILWMLRPDRQPTPWSGRYLVVIETSRTFAARLGTTADDAQALNRSAILRTAGRRPGGQPAQFSSLAATTQRPPPAALAW